MPGATTLVVYATISAAVLCWAAGIIRKSRGWWTLGAMLALVHSAAAFGVFYGWSHTTAQGQTAAQTLALTGVDFAGGIYLNYLFLAVWLGDMGWWWLSPATYRTRPRVVSVAVHGFLFFVIVNGAIVFADGWARVVGVLAVSAVLLQRLPNRGPRRSLAPS